MSMTLARSFRVKTLALAIALAAPLAQAQDALVAPKPATPATQAANAQLLQELPFADTSDFADAQRGLIAKPDVLTIKNASGNVVWDLESYKKYIGLNQAAPAEINPSLYRLAQLNMQYGLFKVTERIYQVRGYDLSNVTFIQGDTGWIVIDPLISTETARAALELANKSLGKRPVVAVIYSHSHTDHYGGARGLATEAEFASGKIRVIAPEGFTEHAISENVIAGNAMSRRAIYMYGALLPRNERGAVTAGLGQTTSAGNISLVLPTESVSKTGTQLTVDGVQMEFQMTPGTEAPVEMNTWFPQFKAMWMAENVSATMHNILTLRGAQVRDALVWSHYLNESIDTYGPMTEVTFQGHHWPKWGNEKIVDFWKKQRDLYKYTHDQSVNLMNKGYTGEEISELIKLPPELDTFWANRGYYGTLKHNSRAVYQRYMGWYSGNPSDLNNLPPEAAAKKYMDYMGGEASVMSKAYADFDKGEYRWVAEVLKHAVFADPGNQPAKSLLADTYEQMGYQAESGAWRGVYLQGAHELRNGVPNVGSIKTASPDVLTAMTPEMLFDYLSVRLDGPKAAGKKIGLNIEFTDLKTQYGLAVENAVLNHGKPLPTPDATLTLSKTTLDALQLKKITLQDAVANGDLKVSGNRQKLDEFLGLLDTFPFWFNIVTP